jgi:glycogen debranching enzyme
VPKVLKALEWAATKFGYLNLTPAYSMEACSQWPRVYQNSTVWPSVQGEAILALTSAGEERTARREMEKWKGLKGFNEWYDPGTGRPMGSAGQLWSAASFLQASMAVEEGRT